MGSLDLSNAHDLQDFNATGNPGLSCVQVENPEESNAQEGVYVNWFTDPGTGYSDECAAIAMLTKGNMVLDTKDTEGNTDRVLFTSGSIVLYPNPAKEQLNIILAAENELVNVSIYTIDGEWVATSKNTNINLSGLAEGVYFVSIQLTDGERITKKVIVSGE